MLFVASCQTDNSKNNATTDNNAKINAMKKEIDLDDSKGIIYYCGVNSADKGIVGRYVKASVHRYYNEELVPPDTPYNILSNECENHKYYNDFLVSSKGSYTVFLPMLGPFELKGKMPDLFLIVMMMNIGDSATINQNIAPFQVSPSENWIKSVRLEIKVEEILTSEQFREQRQIRAQAEGTIKERIAQKRVTKKEPNGSLGVIIGGGEIGNEETVEVISMKNLPTSTKKGYLFLFYPTEIDKGEYDVFENFMNSGTNEEAMVWLLPITSTIGRMWKEKNQSYNEYSAMRTREPLSLVFIETENGLIEYEIKSIEYYHPTPDGSYTKTTSTRQDNMSTYSILEKSGVKLPKHK